MDRLHISVVALLGVASCSHEWISGSVSVRRGDNITLYCDCKLSTGVHIVWYRNCSHENQPPLVIKLDVRSYRLAHNQGQDTKDHLKILPHFEFVRNFSSDSYDLLIMNITDSDEGLYYCGTRQRIVDDKELISSETVYRNGNVTTRISINSSPDHSSWNENPVPDKPSLLMVFGPAITILSSVIAFILVYHFYQKTGGVPAEGQGEDECFTHVVFQAVEVKKHQ
ncbi:uncharacterized protein LOC134102911 [Pungitius pungitius]|uniref:uncharacterized protein LOC134102911 n=1 Tax=Pungitius pungitius TaxID=134920 RepID=UPI002E168982